ncbi:hypothetical protein NW764_009560 [Fusarium oxysporum]|nr:hypothetical protein NW764_009560 [Fusarium oxysporum]
MLSFMTLATLKNQQLNNVTLSIFKFSIIQILDNRGSVPQQARRKLGKVYQMATPLHSRPPSQSHKPPRRANHGSNLTSDNLRFDAGSPPASASEPKNSPQTTIPKRVGCQASDR